VATITLGSKDELLFACKTVRKDLQKLLGALCAQNAGEKLQTS
jgi:hypothetical protein